MLLSRAAYNVVHGKTVDEHLYVKTILTITIEKRVTVSLKKYNAVVNAVTHQCCNYGKVVIFSLPVSICSPVLRMPLALSLLARRH